MTLVWLFKHQLAINLEWVHFLSSSLTRARDHAQTPVFLAVAVIDCPSTLLFLRTERSVLILFVEAVILKFVFCKQFNLASGNNGLLRKVLRHNSIYPLGLWPFCGIIE